MACGNNQGLAVSFFFFLVVTTHKQILTLAYLRWEDREAEDVKTQEIYQIESYEWKVTVMNWWKIMLWHVTSRVTVDIIINFGRRQLRRPIMPDDYLWMWASSMIAIIAWSGPVMAVPPTTNGSWTCWNPDHWSTLCFFIIINFTIVQLIVPYSVNTKLLRSFFSTHLTIIYLFS